MSLEASMIVGIFVSFIVYAYDQEKFKKDVIARLDELKHRGQK